MGSSSSLETERGRCSILSEAHVIFYKEIYCSIKTSRIGFQSNGESSYVSQGCGNSTREVGLEFDGKNYKEKKQRQHE